MWKSICNLWIKILVIFSYHTAIKGYVNSQYILGKLYTKLSGRYLPKAFAWMTIASDHGHAKAKEAVALLNAKLTIEHLEQGRNLIKIYKNKQFGLHKL